MSKVTWEEYEKALEDLDNGTKSYWDVADVLRWDDPEPELEWWERDPEPEETYELPTSMEPYTGIKGARYTFMEDNMTATLSELWKSGELDGYLERVQERYIARQGEIFAWLEKKWDLYNEARYPQMGGAQDRKIKEAIRTSQDLAFHEVVESMGL